VDGVEKPYSVGYRVGSSSFNIFSVDDLEQYVENGYNSVLLDNQPKEVSLFDLVPDLIMGWYNGPRYTAQDIKLKMQIGQGGYSVVYKAKINDQPVAVKQVTFTKESQNEKNKIRREFGRELSLHSCLDHPNIVRVNGISLDKNLSIIMDHCSFGDLFGLLCNWSRDVPYKFRFRVAIELALQYCHRS